MEETSQQEQMQEAENKNQNEEEEGGIRRRLRDRELLRKRKAEAEEKETNQAESQRKRSRAENRSGSKRRGRPRKADAVPPFPVPQEEAGDPAALVASAPAGVISGQTLSSQTATPAVEAQRAPDVEAAAQVPVLQVVRNDVFEKLDVDYAPVPVQRSAPAGPVPVDASYGAPEQGQASYGPPEPVEASFGAPEPVEASYGPPEPVEASFGAPEPVEASYAVPNPVKALNDVPVQLPAPEDVPFQFPDAVPFRAPSQDSESAAALAPPSAPPRVETLYTESGGRESLDRVLIEDLGPDDEDDVSPSQNDREDEGFNEPPLMNKMYSVPTLSGPPLPQEYFPGNQL
ncbi:skin secretory protein xP2 isoform X2 [Fundulus heteroclitus]|uniref:skin secretory protein xP2 isoform X2 n=1 Tax=Fundulus heteroclitus TaxID=8078 RepID=UPI00165C7C1B|nr:skin secretory protein xP2 isoform X2 [Fundulus heteroclitus]